MWIEIRVAPNLIIAEMWKELFEAEGIPTRLLPEGTESGYRACYRIMVPKVKKHLIEEILRKV